MVLSLLRQRLEGHSRLVLYFLKSSLHPIIKKIPLGNAVVLGLGVIHSCFHPWPGVCEVTWGQRVRGPGSCRALRPQPRGTSGQAGSVGTEPQACSLRSAAHL